MAKLQELEAIRGSTIICYVTSTRPNLDSPMAMDVIPIVYKHLRAIGTPRSETTIDLFLHSNGGEGVVPWRLVSLIREHCAKFNVLIPDRAFSAATLTALGADEIIMHPMGMLGPIDPTVSNQFNPPNDRNPAGPPLGISVEDVASYFSLVKEEVKISHEDELVQALIALTNRVHPLALGNVKRLTLQSRMMGERLLRIRNNRDMSDHQVREVIDKLTSQLYYHGHPIGRREAREDIGLPFVKDANDAEEVGMWNLFSCYFKDLSLGEPWDASVEALKHLPAPLPAPPTVAQMQAGNVIYQAQQTFNDVVLPPLTTVYVESTHGVDTFQQEVEVTVTRRPDGTYTFAQLIRGFGWNVGVDAPAGSDAASEVDANSGEITE